MATWLRWSVGVLLAAAALIVGILQLEDDGGPRTCARPALPSADIAGSVHIDNLRKGQGVESPEPIAGAYSNIRAGSDLWILVYATRSDRFYPQSNRGRGPVELRSGRFRGSASFGGRAGESYEVIGVVVDKAASEFFSETLDRWEKRGSSPGLSRRELPSVLDEKDCVPVVLAVDAATTTTTTTSTTTATTTTTALSRSFSLEVERATLGGEERTRSEASSRATRWLRAGESANLVLDISTPGPYHVSIRYSNDNFGALETVTVAIDGATIGQFQASDTGDGGFGWNVFSESPVLGPVDLVRGSHELTVSISGGDGNGVEIDVASGYL